MSRLLPDLALITGFANQVSELLAVCVWKCIKHLGHRLWITIN